MTGPYRQAIIRQWFDSLANSINQQVKEASVFSHKPAIGSSRENRLRELLARVLPSLVEIGQGQMLFSDGSLSPQCDIVLFDARCPRFLEADGIGVYPAEGVIASIEVRSRLDISSLKQALDHLHKCIPPGLNVVNLTDEQCHRYCSDVNFFRDLFPKTYLLGYTSTLDARKCGQAIREWVSHRSTDGSFEGHFLPRVISLPEVTGISVDQIRQVSFDPQDMNSMKEFEPWKPIHGSFACKLGIQVLLSDIVLEVSRRIGPKHHAYDITMAASAAVPYELYGDQFRAAKQTWLMAQVSPDDPETIVGQIPVDANY